MSQDYIFTMLYPWLKTAHILFVIFWMAGLFMLPRFFVYHQEAAEGSEEAARWVDREKRLLKIILNPSIIIVWLLGLALAWVLGVWGEGWFIAKAIIVLALSGYHGWMAGYAKALARGERRLEGKRLRLLNEVPGLAALLIVTLVVIRPF